jgi:hypothetical protein
VKIPLSTRKFYISTGGTLAEADGRYVKMVEKFTGEV